MAIMVGGYRDRGAEMSYAELLRDMFPGLEPTVDDLCLLETHQIKELRRRVTPGTLATVLHAHPHVRQVLVARCPDEAAAIDRILAEHQPAAVGKAARDVQDLLWEVADLIVYQREPAAYDALAVHEWDFAAVTDVVSLDDKVVIDAGAGTGRVAFEACAAARYVFAVEPSSVMRRYMRTKAEAAGIRNLFVLDGFLNTIPLPAATGEVLVTCRAIGWRLDDELAEIDRVVASGGVALHLLGTPHPAEPGDRLDSALFAHGYEPGTYREGSGLSRRYIKHMP